MMMKFQDNLPGCPHAFHNSTNFVVSTSTLKQWALDFQGNLERTLESIKRAKEHGSKLRIGPELELSGYSCEDHFLEYDTIRHCWETLSQILQCGITNDILCAIGMPVVYRGVRYNCCVFVLNGRVILISPKTVLADYGCYIETRWFTPWPYDSHELHELQLPQCIQSLPAKQGFAPMGLAVIQTLDNVAIASEACEELWSPQSRHIQYYLDGVDIIINASGSYHELNKNQTRFQLLSSATSKCGGVYLYANSCGCEGGRTYFDGCGMIVVNGQLIGQSKQFPLSDIEVLSKCIDIDTVKTFRTSIPSRCQQSSRSVTYKRVIADIYMSPNPFKVLLTHRDTPIPLTSLSRQEQIWHHSSMWLWDYLRRSGSKGMFLCLSGGADSAAVGTMVGGMSHILMEAVERGDESTIAILESITHISKSDPKFPKTKNELCRLILYTAYLRSKNSSTSSEMMAERVAMDIGSTHKVVNIDAIVNSCSEEIGVQLGREPEFELYGGTRREDLSLQNIQARTRMAMAYFLASLICPNGTLLVLGTGNNDETIVGYLTKYDCSAADINLIGSLSKDDIRNFLRWGSETLGYDSLKYVLDSKPSAELKPSAEGEQQLDEVDMGFTYAELGVFASLRKDLKLGPVSIFEYLCYRWYDEYGYSPREIADKVKRFFTVYGNNRHKSCVLTPVCHMTTYGCDDNRFDMRPILYPKPLIWQFDIIDAMVNGMEGLVDVRKDK